MSSEGKSEEEIVKNEVEKELEEFFSENPSEKNLFDYWKVKKSVWPLLYELYLTYSSIPVTNIGVEFMFSGLQHIYSYYRTRLSPVVAELMCMYLFIFEIQYLISFFVKVTYKTNEYIHRRNLKNITGEQIIKYDEQ